VTTQTSKLSRILASIDPRLWEVLFPPQPPWLSQVAVTAPLPEPWRYANDDFQLQVQVAARDVARRIVDAAAATSAQGGDGAAVIARSVDEWVHVDDGDGTGKVPIDVFFPRFWWFDPPRPPRPNEDVELAPALAAAAWSFSTMGDTVRDPSLRDAIDAAVGNLVERADSSLRRQMDVSHPTSNGRRL